MLVNDLTHSDKIVRMMSAYGLGQLRSATAVPSLVRATRDGDSDVRRTAVAAIGVMARSQRREIAFRRDSACGGTVDGEEAIDRRILSAVPALVHALADGCEEVRRAATFSLRHIRPKNDPSVTIALAKTLRDPSDDIAGNAARSLLVLKTTDQTTLRVVEETLRDARPSRRRAAAYVLGEFGAVSQCALPVLHKRLQEEKDIYVRRQIQDAIKRITATTLPQSTSTH
jgi:HEAT repeat protein